MTKIGWSLLAIGAAAIIAGNVYHFFVRPDWTEPEAFRGMWELWLSAIAVILIGSCFLKRAE